MPLLLKYWIFLIINTFQWRVSCFILLLPDFLKLLFHIFQFFLKAVCLSPSSMSLLINAIVDPGFSLSYFTLVWSVTPWIFCSFFCKTWAVLVRLICSISGWMPNGITDWICGHPVSLIWGMLGITAVEIFKKCTRLHGDNGKYVTKVEKKYKKSTQKGNCGKLC